MTTSGPFPSRQVSIVSSPAVTILAVAVHRSSPEDAPDGCRSRCTSDAWRTIPSGGAVVPGHSTQVAGPAAPGGAGRADEGLVAWDAGDVPDLAAVPGLQRDPVDGVAAVDVRLEHDRDDRLLRAPARLQKAREVAPLTLLRDQQLDLPDPRLPRPGAVPVAMRHPLLGRELAEARADLITDLGLDVDGRRATGVRLRAGGPVTARRGVILTAGSLRTPQLLTVGRGAGRAPARARYPRSR